MKRLHCAAALCGLAAHALCASDPGPTQSPGAVNPPYHGAAINAPFPDNYYGADHGGSSLSLSYAFTNRFGRTDHSRGVISYYCAPFTPRNSEGVYGMDVWLEASVGGGAWSPAGSRGGLADGAGSAYQPVNTPNPGPSPAYNFQWTFDNTPLPAEASFRVWVYVYLYNQGGGSQGNFYVATGAGSVSSGAANDAPSIAWDAGSGSINPGTVVAGQSYLISATGTDDNGNLARVQIFRNGQAFAAAGSGDGWSSSASGGSADSAGTITYTAQATDSAGLVSPIISLNVTDTARLNQPAVASLDASVHLGQAFTPTELGGAGTGGWQFAIGGYTNFNAGVTGDAGTDLPAGGWIAAWTAPSPGSYAFWVSHNGDASYAPSAVAGPYTLTVIDPSAGGAPSTPPPAPSTGTPPSAGPSPSSGGSGSATSSPPASAPPPASTAPSPPSYPLTPVNLQPVNPLPPTSPSAPPPLIARIRFNSTGRDATVHSRAGQGNSALWTDPAGLSVSPWPPFTPARTATVTTGSFVLPAPGG